MSDNKPKTSAAISGLMNDINSFNLKTADERLVEENANNKQNQKEGVASTMLFPQTPPDSADSDTTNNKVPYQINYLPTSQIKRWKYANRQYLNFDSCESLINSIEKQGQHQPAIVREIDGQYELICGSRRLFSCEYLGIELLVAIVTLNDKEAALLMDLENRERKDISAYERGVDYKLWLTEKIYKNQNQICEAIGVKKAYLSQLLSIADLDKKIVNAFGDPNNLPQRWAYSLYLLSKDKVTKTAMLNVAAKIDPSKNDPAEVYKILKDVANTPLSQAKENETHIIKDKKGMVAAKIKTNSKGKTNIELSMNINHEVKAKVLNLIKNELEV